MKESALEFLENTGKLVAGALLTCFGAAFVFSLVAIAFAIEALPYAFGIWVLHKLCGFPF